MSKLSAIRSARQARAGHRQASAVTRALMSHERRQTCDLALANRAGTHSETQQRSIDGHDGRGKVLQFGAQRDTVLQGTATTMKDRHDLGRQTGQQHRSQSGLFASMTASTSAKVNDTGTGLHQRTRLTMTNRNGSGIGRQRLQQHGLTTVSVSGARVDQQHRQRGGQQASDQRYAIAV